MIQSLTHQEFKEIVTKRDTLVAAWYNIILELSDHSFSVKSRICWSSSLLNESWMYFLKFRGRHYLPIVHSREQPTSFFFPIHVAHLFNTHPCITVFPWAVKHLKIKFTPSWVLDLGIIIGVRYYCVNYVIHK